jgi:hypothetical protein
MAPDAPKVGNVRTHAKCQLGESCRQTAEQIKDQVLQVPKIVFHIVPKDPQVKHVAAEVQPPGMHEH